MASKQERPAVWVGHVTLRTPELPAMHDFLLALGMRPIQLGEDFAVLELRGGTHLVLIRDPAPVSGPAGFDLMVDELGALRERLLTLGFAPSAIESGRIHDSFSVVAPSGQTLTFNSSHVSGRPV